MSIVSNATLERFPTVDAKMFIWVRVSLLDTLFIVSFELLDVLVLFTRWTSNTGIFWVMLCHMGHKLGGKEAPQPTLIAEKLPVEMDLFHVEGQTVCGVLLLAQITSLEEGTFLPVHFQHVLTITDRVEGFVTNLTHFVQPHVFWTLGLE